jgi:hypothetical protein
MQAAKKHYAKRCSQVIPQPSTSRERIIVLLSASPEGEARLPMPKGMAYKE